jgi:hypothetical protein
MEECSACPFGTYQTEKGQSRCLSCPVGTTTNKTSRTSADDCVYFDVFANGLAERTIIGSFTTNQTQVLTMSVWLKAHNEIHKNTTIVIGDSNGDIINLRVASEISIQVESGYESKITNYLVIESVTICFYCQKCLLDLRCECVSFILQKY